ncbi:WAT1-related protein At4g08290-like [Bidens hawaiensis]|uniref:WAT1-related protein At4g08290-like n=1 Tax=Bidens hawaiensis TaxID=980011 RepID=UPI004049D43F
MTKMIGFGDEWPSENELSDKVWTPKTVFKEAKKEFDDLLESFGKLAKLLEELDLSLLTGKAKVIGTLVGVGGAMLLSFYKGPELIKIKSIHIFGQSMKGHMTAAHTTTDQILGFVYALVYSNFYNFQTDGIFIMQSNLSRKYPCHYTTAFLYSSIGFMESAVYALIMERGLSFWSLYSKIRLFSAIIQGVCSALSIYLVMTAVHLQGPLFVSSFNPLALVFVMALGCFILSERLFFGSLLGSMVIIAGLCLVLWAKKKETTEVLNSTNTPTSFEGDELVRAV